MIQFSNQIDAAAHILRQFQNCLIIMWKLLADRLMWTRKQRPRNCQMFIN